MDLTNKIECTRCGELDHEDFMSCDSLCESCHDDMHS